MRENSFGWILIDKTKNKQWFAFSEEIFSARSMDLKNTPWFLPHNRETMDGDV